MLIKLSEVINNVENLKAIQEVKLPVKISYRIARLVNKLQPEANLYEEKRVNLLKELGELDEKGEKYDIKYGTIENQAKFWKEISELLAMEIEIDFTKIKVEELGEVNMEAKLLNLFIFE